MKIFKLPQLAELSGLAEYVLSAEGSGATALRWGRLLPKETGRKVSSAGTATGIVYIVKGNLSVKHGKSAFPVGAGEAFFINGAADLGLDNTGEAEAVYIVACGHSTPPEKTGQTPTHTASSIAARESGEASAMHPAQPQQPDDEFEITKDDPPCDDDNGGGLT